MTTDRDIAIRALHFQANSREYPLITLPAYERWSKQKLADGESEALIAHLDAIAVVGLPEEMDRVGPETFEEMLAELKSDIGLAD